MLNWILAVVILGLALYIYWLLRDGSKRTDAQREREQKRDARVQGHRRDLDVLLRCLIDEQMEPAEACLRVKLVLNALANLGHELPKHEVFERMYLELEDHPVQDARKRLDKPERMRWDLKRWEIEGRYRDALAAEGKDLLDWLNSSAA